MMGTPGSSGAGARREQTGTVASPRNGIGANNGRMTPVRTRNGESTFTTPNMMSGYETPTNKILTHVPSTVTNRSSERRRRLKFDGNESSGLGDKSLALSAGFMDAKSGRVRAPTFDTSAPPMRERSNSNGSVKSENVFTPRALTKVNSLPCDRPLSKPLQPTSKSSNFFHANEEQDTRPSPGDPSEMFFFAANNVRNVASKTSLNPNHQRRLSNSSQYSSLSNVKEPCDQNLVPTTPNRIYPRSSPSSPSKSNFNNPPSNTRTSPPLGLKNDAPGSPLRSCPMISRSPSPTKEQLSPSPPQLSCESKPLSANTSAPPGVSDTSEDDLNTKSLLPAASDLESSARINRKVRLFSQALIIDR